VRARHDRDESGGRDSNELGRRAEATDDRAALEGDRDGGRRTPAEAEPALGGDRDGGKQTPDEAEPALAETETCPEAPTRWLAEVEGRIDHAERLTDASVVEAAAVIEERGGLAAVERLSEQTAADERALRSLAERATALADRAARTDVPVDALWRLS
jgi:hypothetical protein